MTLLSQFEDLKMKVAILEKKTQEQAATVARQEEQINGERGLSAAINAQTAEIRGLRKAAYMVAALIVGGSITFAFSAFSLIGGGP